MSAVPRITLSRIVALHWYGFRQVIDLHGLTLFCGENGTGKSAILDLVQFVLLGSGSRGAKFNRAATGDGTKPRGRSRDLRGYCLCDSNTQTKDGQPRFLRSGGVTVAALEFTWPATDAAEPRRETWGVRVEFDGPTSDARYVWFMAPQRLEISDVLADDGKIFLDDLAFRTLIQRMENGGLKGDASFQRHGSFLAEMADRRHLGFDAMQMVKTLPGALAFQPLEDFGQFIRENILEPGLPEVREVRQSLDSLRDAERQVAALHDQLEYLQRISNHHQKYAVAQREAALAGHLVSVLNLSEASERHERAEHELATLREKYADDLKRMADAKAESDAVDHQLAEVRLVAGQDSQISKLDDCKREQEKKEKEIARLRPLVKNARQYFLDLAHGWDVWLRRAEGLGFTKRPDEARLKDLRSAKETEAHDAVGRLAVSFNDLSHEANREHLEPIEKECETVKRRIAQLEQELQSLLAGSTGPAPLLQALKARGTSAQALGRVVEVNAGAENWWPWLETLLGEDRKAVLVEKADWLGAWAMFLKTKTDEPLVNPTELAEMKTKPLPGSLAAFLTTTHPVAQKWLDHHLGQIMPVTSAEELERHEAALTADGILKATGVRRRLEPDREFTLGEEGLRRRREAREAELAVCIERQGSLQRQADSWKAWMSEGQRMRLNSSDTPISYSDLNRLPELEREVNGLAETINILETPERKDLLERLRVLDRSRRGLDERVGGLKKSITAFQLSENQAKEALEEAVRQLKDATLDEAASRATMPAGILETEISERLTKAMAQFPNWTKRREAATGQRSAFELTAQNSRRDRDDERIRLADAHGDFRHEFDVAEPSNDAWERRREQLETHGLAHYISLAEERRKEWEERLQSKVLDVLKEKISEAQDTIRDLNRALDRDVGKFRYRIAQHRDQTQSALWELINNGLGALRADDPLSQFAQKDTLEKARRELMEGIDADAGDERARRVLDYRSYHTYDLEMRPTGFAGEGGVIRLSQHARKMSGGENQAPFFVAMLAAFHRVYDLGRREPRQNLAMVVMDEAFSKLSSDRIDDCLALARAFGLQLVLAFPMDRLGTMIEHAETVIECRVEVKRDEQGQPKEIDNWVIPWRKDRLLEVMA